MMLRTFARCTTFPCFSWMLAACLFLALLAGGSASAQGTMGAVADPISTRDLDDYAKRLGLSPQQRASLDQMHEMYKTEFAFLREGEIEKFLAESASAGGRGGMGMMMMGNIDRKAAEDSLRQLQSINNKINAVDARLFDQMSSILTEEQVARMTGVRQARERQRYRTGLSRMAMFTNPSTQADLSQMVADLSLSPDERAGAEPLLDTYEMSLTSATKKLHDGANEATVKMLDKLAELGFNADALRDGGRRGEMWEAMRNAWSEVMTRINERASDISELNRKTQRALSSTLVADNSRRLHDEFFNRAYPEIRSSSATARAFDVAMSFDDLTEEQRAALSTIYDEFRIKSDQLTQKMADLVDEQRKTRTAFEFGRGRGERDNRGDGPQEQALNELRDQRRQLVDGVRGQIETTLGPEMAGQLERRVAEARERQREERAVQTVVIAGPGGELGMTARFEGSPIVVEGATIIDRDPFVPAAISGRDLEGYATRLGLDDEKRMILSGLHSEYSERYQQIEESEIKAVRDAEESLRERDEQGNRSEPPTPEGVDRVYALRRSAIEAIRMLDSAFFDDVQVALLDDASRPRLERVRQSRERAVYNRAAGSQGLFNIGGGGGGRRGGDRGGAQRVMFTGGPFGGGSSEASVDLSVLVEDADIAAADPSALDAALAEYEVAATAAFRSMFETSMRMRQAMERMAGQFTRGGRGDGNVAINADSMRQTMEADGRASREARQTLVALNRQTLEQLVSHLDSSNAAQLRRAYNRKAFPDVFRDSRSAQRQIDAALDLPDLSDPQREQVRTIAADFFGAYEALSDQMIAIERSAPALGEAPGRGGQSGFDLGAMQERLRERERLEFERNDASDKALARLRTTLTAEQVQRIGLEPLAGSY